jgi:putative N-acetylmannosamine-6-phosphate epimerase
MKTTELQLLESKLDSIASRITYNRGKVDSINEQIKALTELRIEHNALIVADCKAFDDTINQIKIDTIEKNETLKQYAHNRIRYGGLT